jgi:hypothetical protein
MQLKNVISSELIIFLNNNGRDNLYFAYKLDLGSQREPIEWVNAIPIQIGTQKSFGYGTYKSFIDNIPFVYYVNSDNIQNVSIMKLNTINKTSTILMENFKCSPNLYYCDNLLNYRVITTTNNVESLQISSSIKNSNGINYLEVNMNNLNTSNNDFSKVKWDLNISFVSKFRDRNEFILLSEKNKHNYYNFNLITLNPTSANKYSLTNLSSLYISYPYNVIPENILSYNNTNTLDGLYKPTLISFTINNFQLIFMMSVSNLNTSQWTIYIYDTNNTLPSFTNILENISIKETFFPEWVITGFDIDPNIIIDGESFLVNVYGNFYFTNSTDPNYSKSRIIKLQIQIVLNNSQDNLNINSKIIDIKRIIDIPVSRLSPATIIITNSSDTDLYSSSATLNTISYGIFIFYCFLFIFVNKYYYDVIFL